MEEEKIEAAAEKQQLHARNRHNSRYDFEALVKSCPELRKFMILNKYQDETIEFSNPEAVKTLNKALLFHYYDLKYWDIPKGYLCPPIPGRADYIHNLADLLAIAHDAVVPTGEQIRCLDIGIGANCVYPIIGVKEYGWSFVGTDVDSVALAAATKIISENPNLTGKVELRLQTNAKDIFDGIIQPGEQFDLTMCNPPFHASQAAASESAQRKIKNLHYHKKTAKPTLNFGGQNQELWYEGGEMGFVTNMIDQSVRYKDQVKWFTTLLSKESNIRPTYKALKKARATAIKLFPMGQGNKVSRMIAWKY
jgi:23S rRNA (adenine1618-N6)-methyltransferase